MRYILTGFYLVVGLCLYSAYSYAEEVLVVTWQGKTRAEAGFEERLKQLRSKVKFRYIDADRKKVTLQVLLERLNLSSIDLVYSYGTTGTAVVKEFLKGRKPHVFNIVSAPVQSGIVSSLEKPGNNITGAKLMVDIEEQLKFLKKLRDYKTLGVWFDPRENQSDALVARIFEICDRLGVKADRFRFIPDAGNIQNNLRRLSSEANELDALYVIGSSSYTNTYPIMFRELDPRLLVMGSVFRQVGFGATVSFGTTYDERGYATAELAHKILSGQAAGDLPVDVIKPEKATLFVDPDKIERAGIKNISKLGVKIEEIRQPLALRKSK